MRPAARIAWTLRRSARLVEHEQAPFGLEVLADRIVADLETAGFMIVALADTAAAGVDITRAAIASSGSRIGSTWIPGRPDESPPDQERQV